MILGDLYEKLKRVMHEGSIQEDSMSATAFAYTTPGGILLALCVVTKDAEDPFAGKV